MRPHGCCRRAEHFNFAKALNRADYLITLARLRILVRLAGRPPETPTDTAIREQGERLQKAFPEVDFHEPRRYVR
jgi:hypothetical protein